MAKQLRLRRGTTTQHSSFTGAEGEVTVDTTKDTVVVHDGSTAGGRSLLREDLSNLAAGAIAHAKLAGDAVDGDNIADDSINSEHYVDGSIDEAHIADNQVSLAKMANLDRGRIIYGDASNNPTALAPGSNGQVLQSDGTDIAWQNSTAGAVGGNSNSNRIFWENEQTVTHDYTITNNHNAGSFGPITINSGVTITVGSGENWTIV
tara:strand:+ start:1170 stop:1787 length:618 start_codon:yes stop_codon:yes gene_type:complete